MAKILIVDDDPIMVDSAKLCLEKDGHDVMAAHNRADGMKAIEANMPDLLILDVMMEQPDDGIAMAQELKRSSFSKPILMLTSMGKVIGNEYGKDEEVNPVDEFLEKPVKPAVLIEKVNGLLTK